MSKPYHTLTIHKIREETEGFKTFHFREEEDNPVQYRAGQYLTLVLPKYSQEIRRSYSIISAPGLSEPLAIGIKRIKNGLVSRPLIDNAQPGDNLFTTGVGGLFTLPDFLAGDQQLFFLAAGSGITPVFSLIKTVLHFYPALSVILIYSNRSPEATIFREQLQQLASQFPNRFQIEFIYSNSPDLARAHLYKDFLENLIGQYARVSFDKILSYVCGPLNYMRICTYALRELQIPAANIRKEHFNTDKPAVLVVPPDQESHLVTLRFRKQEYTLPVKYPDTILQAARKAGIAMGYSCEAGRCGNCIARCVQGQVWLSYNEVLTEKDLAQGLTLTCVGYPVGGDVVLEI